MSLDYEIIGGRIKKARRAKNLTQEDLSEEIDVSVAFLSRIERGNSHINLLRLTQICDILEVSTDYVLNGTDSEKKNYLEPDFAELLENCSAEKQKMIYEIVRTIAKNK